MSVDGQRTKWRRKIGENFHRLSRAHERYRQTDGRTADDIFTFANENKLPRPPAIQTPVRELNSK